MAIKYQQVSRQAPSPSDPYYEADRQRQLADALMQQANQPRNFGTASSGQANTMGLTQLAQALLARYVGKQADGTLNAADAQTNAQNAASLESLSPSTYNPIDRPPTALESVDPSQPATPLLGTEHVGPAMINNQHSALVSALAGQDPRMVRSFLSQQQIARALPPPQQPAEPFTLGEGQVRFGPDGKQIASGPAKTLTPTRGDIKTRSMGNGYNQDYRIDPVTGAESKQGDPYKENPTKAAMFGQAEANGFTGDALTNAAERYRQTGTLPNLGMGSSALKVKIINKAADLSSLNGDDASAASMRQQANKAGQSALGQITKQKTVTGAFEKTAIANLDLALSKSADVARSGSPLFNRAIIAFKNGVQGDADTGAFVNALTAARNEYAKVLSSSTGAQGITDSARKEAEDLFSKIDSPEALAAKIALAKQEMGNRMSGFDQQIGELNPLIGGVSPTAPAASGWGSATVVK